MEPPSISLKNINLGFNGEPLFQNFTIELGGGQCTCLLGPSGCGKSTLLSLVAGNPSLKWQGEVSFSPRVVGVESIGWMGQDDLLLPWMSVRNNVLLGARLRGEIDPAMVQRADHLIARAGLEGSSGSLPGELSGGMRQRVALLRTLIEERPVILMDEPFSALDALTRMKLQDLAADMTRGRTVLLVTHDPMEALRLGDRIIVLGKKPVTARSVIEMGGETPRSVQDPELVNSYPRLLELVMSEGGL